MPAADISEQLSTAGKEASGTGNMKFMMNGAVTVGTMDGANVEIYDQAGPDNIYIFGMRAETVDSLYREGSYMPMHIYENNAELRRALTQIIDGTLFPDNPATLQDIYHNLLFSDPYFVLKDFGSYSMAQRRVDADYQNQSKWLRMAITNTACSGVFSSDRTIREYNEKIWRAQITNAAKEAKRKMLCFRKVRGNRSPERFPRFISFLHAAAAHQQLKKLQLVIQGVGVFYLAANDAGEIVHHAVVTVHHARIPPIGAIPPGVGFRVLIIRHRQRANARDRIRPGFANFQRLDLHRALGAAHHQLPPAKAAELGSAAFDIGYASGVLENHHAQILGVCAIHARPGVQGDHLLRLALQLQHQIPPNGSPRNRTCRPDIFPASAAFPAYGERSSAPRRNKFPPERPPSPGSIPALPADYSDTYIPSGTAAAAPAPFQSAG